MLFLYVGGDIFVQVESRVIEMLGTDNHFLFGAIVLTAAVWSARGHPTERIRAAFIQLLLHDRVNQVNAINRALPGIQEMPHVYSQIHDAKWIFELLRDVSLQASQSKFHLVLGSATSLIRILGWRSVPMAAEFLKAAIVPKLDGEILQTQAIEIGRFLQALAGADPFVRVKSWFEVVLDKFLVPNETTYLVYLAHLLGDRYFDPPELVDVLKTQFEYIYVVSHDEIAIQYSERLQMCRDLLMSSKNRLAGLLDLAIKNYKNMQWNARESLVVSISDFIWVRNHTLDNAVRKQVFEGFVTLPLVDDFESVWRNAMRTFFQLLIALSENLDEWAEKTEKGIVDGEKVDILKGCAVLSEVRLSLVCPEWVMRIVKALFESFSDRSKLAKTIRNTFRDFYQRHQYSGIEGIAEYQSISTPAGFS
jgi:hypothetical protein